jgi:hypothetical protein
MHTDQKDTMTMNFLLIGADRRALPRAKLPERIDALLPERVREVQVRCACHGTKRHFERLVSQIFFPSAKARAMPVES